MAISQVIIAFIEEECDSEDGVPLAWIVFTDTLAGRGKAARKHQRETLSFIEICLYSKGFLKMQSTALRRNCLTIQS